MKLDWKTHREVKESEGSYASGHAIEFSAQRDGMDFRLLRPWGRRVNWRLTVMKDNKIVHDSYYTNEGEAKHAADNFALPPV